MPNSASDRQTMPQAYNRMKLTASLPLYDGKAAVLQGSGEFILIDDSLLFDKVFKIGCNGGIIKNG